MVTMGIPFYQESKDLYNLATKHWDRFTQNKRIEQHKLAQKSHENPLLYEFLKWKYGDYPILERCGNVYPVVVFPAPKHQQRNLNSALLYPLVKDKPKAETFAARDPSFRVLIEKLGAPLENRLTYTMIRLNTQDTLQLTCMLGCYYYQLDTCHSLGWEILSSLGKLGRHDKDSFKIFDDEQLKLRKALHEKVNNPIIDGSGRNAGIGISTLIAYNNNGKMQLWLKRRSRKGVAVLQGLVHVIPSFMFQPMTMFVDEEFDIPHNIFREYLEEIFDRPEPQLGEEEAYNYFYDDPRLQYLHILLGRQEAELLFTGIAIDLLTLTPEICTMLWFKKPDWFSHHSHSADKERFKVNLEFMKGYEERDPLDYWLVTPVPFSHSDSELSQYEYLSPSRITPSGAAAFWLGLEQLRGII